MARLTGRGLYVAGAGLMSRMPVESHGWKIILREIQVRVRSKWLKMTGQYVGNNSSIATKKNPPFEGGSRWLIKNFTSEMKELPHQT